MSDTNFNAVSVRLKKIDIISKDWAEDCLTDDDIDIPKEFDVGLEDQEDEDEEGLIKDEEWNDLGIDVFLSERRLNESQMSFTDTELPKELGINFKDLIDLEEDEEEEEQEEDVENDQWNESDVDKPIVPIESKTSDSQFSDWNGSDSFNPNFSRDS